MHSRYCYTFILACTINPDLYVDPSTPYVCRACDINHRQHAEELPRGSATAAAQQVCRERPREGGPTDGAALQVPGEGGASGRSHWRRAATQGNCHQSIMYNERSLKPVKLFVSRNFSRERLGYFKFYLNFKLSYKLIYLIFLFCVFSRNPLP